MIKITPYKVIYQSSIDKMMLEISEEFDKQIFSKPTNTTPLVPKLYWVAIKNNVVIGTVGVIPINGEFAVLKRMMLIKKFRGSEFGISKLLLYTVIEWCRENGLSKIFLGTMSQFKAAQAFYKKNGFHTINEGELPIDFIKNSLDTVFFQLNLDANDINEAF
tara:strand:+ start:13603 stop:14088 length:486 start_codon:yes stop_codon:yes gene_type:complete